MFKIVKLLLLSILVIIEWEQKSYFKSFEACYVLDVSIDILGYNEVKDYLIRDDAMLSRLNSSEEIVGNYC